MPVRNIISKDTEWNVITKSLSVFTDVLEKHVIDGIMEISKQFDLIDREGRGTMSYWIKVNNQYHLRILYSSCFGVLWNITYFLRKKKESSFLKSIRYFPRLKNELFETYFVCC